MRLNAKKRKWKMFRQITMGLMAVFFVACLAGCGGEGEGDGDVIVLETPSQTYAALEKSESERFKRSDLKVNNVAVMATEQEVLEAFGEPMAQRLSEDGTQKTFFYDQMTMTLIKAQPGYVLEGVRITGNDWNVARNLKVGDNKDAVLEKFYRDENCLNNNVMAEDNETIIGKFLYGNCTLDNLEAYNGEGDVEFAVINYDGYANMEEADNLTYEFVFMEAPFLGEKPSANDDFAQLNIEVDKSGTITEISWYYYDEIKE